VCNCSGGTWGCYNTDACLIPFCPDAGSAEDSGNGADAGELCVEGGPSLQSVPSNQMVTFRLENTGSTDVWAATQGNFCDAFAIDQNSPTAAHIDLSFGFQCGCECPAPPDPHAGTLARIAPGATYDITWDARRLQTAPWISDCGPGFCLEELTGAMGLLGAGNYSVTVGLFNEPPTNCGSGADLVSCNPQFNGGFAGAIAEICPHGHTATQAFDLPENGDLIVNVPVAASGDAGP
jgi:hypothetical protein